MPLSLIEIQLKFAKRSLMHGETLDMKQIEFLRNKLISLANSLLILKDVDAHAIDGNDEVHDKTKGSSNFEELEQAENHSGILNLVYAFYSLNLVKIQSQVFYN